MEARFTVIRRHLRCTRLISKQSLTRTEQHNIIQHSILSLTISSSTLDSHIIPLHLRVTLGRKIQEKANIPTMKTSMTCRHQCPKSN